MEVLVDNTIYAASLRVLRRQNSPPPPPLPLNGSWKAYLPPPPLATSANRRRRSG